MATRHRRLAKGVKECISYLEDHIDALMPIAAEDDEELAREFKWQRRVLPRIPGRPTDKEVNYRKSRMPKAMNG